MADNIQFSAHSLTALDYDPLVSGLIAAEFEEGPDYHVLRRKGSSTWLLLVTSLGQGRVATEAESFQVRPMEVYLWQPQVRQEYGTGPKGLWHFYWAHFQARPHWAPILDWERVGPGLRRVQVADEGEWANLIGLMNKMATYSARRDPYDSWMGQAALEEALIRLQRVHAGAEPREDSRLRAGIDFAMSHLNTGFDVGAMAKASGLSTSRFSHLFRDRMGLSPRAFVEGERMVRARQLLEMSDLPIKDIAAQLGFASEFYFSTRFRRSTGHSPRSFRGR